MRPILCVALLVVAALTGQPLRAQATGDLVIAVIAEQAEIPLPYAVISIPTLSIERFTDARGRLIVPALPVGTYQVTIRRLGYIPARLEVTITANVSHAHLVRLARVPQRLAGMQVKAIGGCERPGVPDEAQEPEVFMLVSLLRENADRYRLLASQYPFLAMQMRALAEVQDDAVLLQSVDSTSVLSATKAGYKAGRVVQRSGGLYSMAIPSILDLADDEFARTHCFFYGGASVDSSVRGTETWLRLDVRAANRLSDPDVHGSFFLDSATAQLRRMELELSRPDKLPRALGSIAAVTAKTTFVEIASGLSVIESICAVTRLKPPTGRRANPSATSTPVELQQIMRYRFTTPPPDVDSTRDFPVPSWRAGQARPRASIWCER